MATSVTVNKNAEYLTWPRMCVCCGGLDETDVEVIVPDTVPRDRDLSEITSAHVPYCFDCVSHTSAGLGAARLIAIGVVLVFVAPIIANGVFHVNLAWAGAAAILALVIVAIADLANCRRQMKASCSSMKVPYAFLHPTSAEITTIRFDNDHFARAFKALNLGVAYEP